MSFSCKRIIKEIKSFFGSRREREKERERISKINKNMQKVDLKMNKVVKEIEGLKENSEKVDSKINKIVKEMSSLKEGSEKFNEGLIKEYKLKGRINKEREKNVILGLINILDSIDKIIENESEEIKSLSLTNKIINREIETMNLRSFPKVGDIYDGENNICIGYKSLEEIEENRIIEVIKKGYMYRGKVLRQAEVIVMKKEKS